jgi:hypothetical protein
LNLRVLPGKWFLGNPGIGKKQGDGERKEKCGGKNWNVDL